MPAGTHHDNSSMFKMGIVTVAIIVAEKPLWTSGGFQVLHPETIGCSMLKKWSNEQSSALAIIALPDKPAPSHKPSPALPGWPRGLHGWVNSQIILTREPIAQARPIMKSAALKFQGVSAFIVTPTSDDGEKLDLATLKRFIDFQIESGVDGITLFGSTGQHRIVQRAGTTGGYQECGDAHQRARQSYEGARVRQRTSAAVRIFPDTKGDEEIFRECASHSEASRRG